MPRVACIGECMLELSGVDNRAMTLSYGGDTLNTAVYLSRLGVETDYVTALGNDPYSDWMLGQWQAEGVGTELVVRAANRVRGTVCDPHRSRRGAAVFLLAGSGAGCGIFFRFPNPPTWQRVFVRMTIFT